MVNPQNAPGNARLIQRNQNYNVPCVNPYNRNRAPTTADIKDPATNRLYPIHCEWRDTVTNDMWKLVDIASNLAQWEKFIGGGTSGTVTELTPDTGGTVQPDGSGNIDIVGQDTASQNGIETFNLTADQMGVRMKSPFTLEDFVFSNATAGTPRIVTVSHSDDTNTGSNARLGMQVGGDSGGDPYAIWTISGANSYSMGIDNSDTNALCITGATTLNGTNLWRMSADGERTMPLQPAFNAYANAQITNVTGDNTIYTVIFNTERFDQNSDFDTSNGVFTAPVTGRYIFNIAIRLGYPTAQTVSTLFLTTSNEQYLFFDADGGAMKTSNNKLSMVGSMVCDMDAADTARVQIQVQGGALDVDIEANFTHFSGYLAT